MKWVPSLTDGVISLGLLFNFSVPPKCIVQPTKELIAVGKVGNASVNRFNSSLIDNTVHYFSHWPVEYLFPRDFSIW